MPRRIAYVLAWGIATAITVGASWLGISSVLSAAAPPRARPLSAADLRRAAPSPTAVAPSRAPLSPTPQRPPSPSTAPVTSRPAAPSARPAPITPTPVSTAWQTEPDGRGGTASRRTFRTAGGDITLWFARGDVRVVSTVAQPGYTVDVERWAPDAVTVSFHAGRRQSYLYAAWRGVPFTQLEELR